MTTSPGFRKVHRFVAALFLLTIPPAAYFSFTGDKAHPSFFVYLPLFPLMFLSITGTWLLIKPWIQTWKARRAA